MTSWLASAPATPLRPLGVAEILDGAVRSVRRNVRAVWTIAAPFAILSAAPFALLELATVESDDAGAYQVLGALFVGSLFGTVLTGLLAPIFTDDALGIRRSARDSLRRVGGRGGFALVILSVAVSICEQAGLFLFVAGGVWLWGIWAVAAPALSVERLGPMRALGRSFALTRTSFWRTWGVRALGWVMTTVLSTLLTLPFSLIAYLVATDALDGGSGDVTHPGLFVTMLALGRLLGAIVVTPIRAAVDALLYLDLRMRREGMDLVLALPPAPTFQPHTATAW